MVPAAAVLMVAGFHVPVILLLETAGNAGAAAPTQSGPIAVNTGVTCAAIVMVAGFQVPVILLLDKAGNAGAAAPMQSGPIAVNTGVTCAAIVISIDTADAH